VSLTKKQRKVLDFDNRIKPVLTILEGAVRSGKTFIDNLLWCQHIYQHYGKNRKFIMTGSTISALKRNVIDDIGEFFDIPTNLNKNNEFELFGNTMCCFGADKIDSFKAIKGFTSYGWYGNEITQHHKNTVDQCFKRCSGPGARIFWDTNPDQPKHYIKTDYIDKTGELLQDGTLRIKSWHFSLEDNTFLDGNYVENLKKSTPSGVWYDRDILGLWVAAEGIIYTDFDYGAQVIEVEPKNLKEYFCGVDWGYDKPGSIGVHGVDGDGNVIRVREEVHREMSMDNWCRIALDITRDYGRIPFYCDPSEPEHIQKFRKAGINAQAANNAVNPGIMFVAEMMKRKKLFFVESKCKGILGEIYGYRWRDNAAKEEPIKADDHSLDDLRYGLFTHLGRGRFEMKRYEGVL
jgi:PBSX family phage terminase large subunit